MMKHYLTLVSGLLLSALGFGQQMDLPVTFDVAGVEYGVIGFEGAEASTIEADPTNAANTVVKVIKSATAQPWAGTTVTNANGDGLANPVPFSAGNTQMSLRVWSPDAGIPVRLKVEDSTNPTISVETEATTTAAGAWETLTFNFANQANGSAALNLANAYNKASVFFNFGTNGATAGEKTYYFDDLEFVGGGGASSYNVTFSVDMNNVTASFTTPEVNGTFNNWCGGCASMSDGDGDGIWTLTASIPVGTHEFKFAYDSWAGSEDLTQGSACTVTNGGFTNRSLVVSNADVVLPTVCWGSCTACNVVVLEQMDLPVTFDAAGVEYGVIGFEGAEASTIEADPTDAANTVVKVIKSASAQPWAGTTITNANGDGLANPIPFSASSTQMSLRVWSPDAGIPVRLKVEDSTNPTISVETEATTTAAGAWETLTFDFANQANGTAALNLANAYNKASVFFNFGTNGATAGEKTYYFDDLQMAGGGGATSYNVTFSVDMNGVTGPFTTPEVNGTFNNWCGGCAAMSDADSDGIWTLTAAIPVGTHEFKFAYDSWAGQENLIQGSPCTVTNGGFTNRSLVVSNADIVMPTVCWESCTACNVAADTFNITFQVDMNAVTQSFTTPEVNGTFNNWCGGCAAMTDANSDGVWELTVAIPAGTYEYKFAADSWAISEQMTEGEPCTVNNGGFINRSLVVNADATLPVVCWGSCSACVTDTGAPYTVLFQVDMSQVTEAYTTPEVNGTFNNWCGGCAPMSDADGDGIWELAIELPAGTFEYKFAADTWAIQESLTPGTPCVLTTGAFTNRQLIVTGTATLNVVCWGSCDACEVGFEDLGTSTFSLAPNPANDQLQLRLNAPAMGKVTIQVMDATGRVIRDMGMEAATTYTLETASLSKGLYFVRVQNGNTVQTRSVVISH